MSLAEGYMSYLLILLAVASKQLHLRGCFANQWKNTLSFSILIAGRD
jgi:hypothetical protein